MPIEFDGMEEDIRAECGELLEAMEDSLLEMQEQGEVDSDKINAVFRAAHTLKGTGGMFEIGYLESFAHLAENILDAIRNGALEMDEKLLKILLESKDQLQAMVDFALGTSKTELEGELAQASERLMKHFRVLLGEEEEENLPPVVKKEEDKTPETSGEGWHIDVVPEQDSFKVGIEPREFLKFLEFEGKIEKIDIDFAQIPDLEEFDPESCYLRYDIHMKEVDSKEAIYSALELASGSWTIEVRRLEKTQQNVSQKTEKVKELQKEPDQPEELSVPAAPSVAQEAPKKESSTTPSVPAKKSSSAFMRVDTSKVDTLINQIGEMVIANASVVQQATDTKNKELMEAVSFVSRMLEEMRESAMKVRMVQIGDTFNRFKRIVHDVARELGKEVNFQTHGGETELDKTVIEKIYDPLIHLIRNGLDHGIETPEVRMEQGKSSQGLLSLRAYYDSGSITIEIKDDGKGIDEERVYAKALEKGLVPPNTTLEKKQIFNLVFHPGFSTADKVSNISGRGVGMDVVKRNIQELRGSIEIDSEKGQGSVITIRLPLTLAIIDGLLLSIGESYYVVPLDMISECIEFTDHFKQQITNNRYVSLRGSLLPILDMREFFHEKSILKKSRDNIVVVHSGGQSVGLLVDSLHGEFQTVIKPLGKVFQNLQGISGGTILGSGEVALILDVPVLIRYANDFFDTYLAEQAS